MNILLFLLLYKASVYLRLFLLDEARRHFRNANAIYCWKPPLETVWMKSFYPEWPNSDHIWKFNDLRPLLSFVLETRKALLPLLQTSAFSTFLFFLPNNPEIWEFNCVSNKRTFPCNSWVLSISTAHNLTVVCFVACLIRMDFVMEVKSNISLH